MTLVREYVERALRGEFDESNMPRYSPSEWARFAREIRVRSKRPVTFPSPSHWGRALGIDRCDTGPCCGSTACGAHGEIVYQDDPDSRVRGQRITFALVQVVSDRWGWGLTLNDTLGVVAELAWPSDIPLPLTDEEAVAANPHAPAWLIRAQVQRIRRARGNVNFGEFSPGQVR